MVRGRDGPQGPEIRKGRGQGRGSGWEEGAASLHRWGGVGGFGSVSVLGAGDKQDRHW